MADALTRQEKEFVEVSNILQSRDPTRVAVIIRARSRLSGNEPTSIITDALSLLQVDAEYLFLVYEKWRRYNIVVFDLFNTQYNWETAHVCNDLPVVLLDYGRKDLRISVAAPMIRREVNSGVAQHHRLNGWKCHPPYLADHTLPRPPSYEFPRDLRYEPAGSSTEAEVKLSETQ